MKNSRLGQVDCSTIKICNISQKLSHDFNLVYIDDFIIIIIKQTEQRLMELNQKQQTRQNNIRYAPKNEENASAQALTNNNSSILAKKSLERKNYKLEAGMINRQLLPEIKYQSNKPKQSPVASDRKFSIVQESKKPLVAQIPLTLNYNNLVQNLTISHTSNVFRLDSPSNPASRLSSNNLSITNMGSSYVKQNYATIVPIQIPSKNEAEKTTKQSNIVREQNKKFTTDQEVLMQQGVAASASPINPAATPSSPNPLNLSTIKNRWRVGQLIGIGSTGQVYKVFDMENGSILAGKKIPRFHTQSSAQKLSLQTQLEMCKIQHPYIVKYHEYVELPHETWIIMDYFPETLESIYRTYGSLEIESVRIYTRQILQAMNFLHQNKIIHKDIKCSNILVGADGDIRLSDFGSSRQFDQTDSCANHYMNGEYSFKGSVLWMAPEIIVNGRSGRKSDVWSVGCAILEMLTGQVPWFHKHFQNELEAVFKIGNSQEIPQIPEEIEDELKEFLKLCFQRDPEKRAAIAELLTTRFIIKQQQK